MQASSSFTRLHSTEPDILNSEVGGTKADQIHAYVETDRHLQAAP
jgi:hypothetical protein